ncbi:hypothetical protein BH24DEI2_BH24DEI2_17270 [soil metagenome]
MFHPLFVAPAALFTVQRLSGATSLQATLWTLFACGTTLLPLFALIQIRVRRGRYEDWDVSRREDRHVLYLVAGLSLLALLAALAALPAPRIVWWSMVTALVAIIVGAFVNLLVHKVSLHVLTDAACATFLVFLQPWVGAALLALCALVAWSRVYLGRHTVPDVLWGFGLGVLCAALVFWLPQGLP